MIPWLTLPGRCAPSASQLWLTGATTSHMAGWRAGAGQGRTGHPPWRKLRQQFGRNGSVNGLCSNTGFLTERIGILSQRKIDFNTPILWLSNIHPPLFFLLQFKCFPYSGPSCAPDHRSYLPEATNQTRLDSPEHRDADPVSSIAAPRSWPRKTIGEQFSITSITNNYSLETSQQEFSVDVFLLLKIMNM